MGISISITSGKLQFRIRAAILPPFLLFSYVLSFLSRPLFCLFFSSEYSHFPTLCPKMPCGKLPIWSTIPVSCNQAHFVTLLDISVQGNHTLLCDSVGPCRPLVPHGRCMYSKYCCLHPKFPKIPAKNISSASRFPQS